MKMTSSAFYNGESIPAKYTCQGQDINPPLEISDVPEKTASLVLVVDDPDAPAGTFTHWILYNMDPSVRVIKEGSVPNGALEGRNTAGNTGYIGACPPSGTHRYFFHLYALNAMLTLNQPNIDELMLALDPYIIDEAELMGTYQKS
jgi:Raf kinase inhibitor-like YbhB/YbcL family protein